MNFNDRLFVEIVPLENAHPPHPHPIRDGKFDPDFVYKILGIYNPSETSECYFMLASPSRELWFIPQRHTRAYRLLDADEFFVPKAGIANHSPMSHRNPQTNGSTTREDILEGIRNAS